MSQKGMWNSNTRSYGKQFRIWTLTSKEMILKITRVRNRERKIITRVEFGVSHTCSMQRVCCV